MFGLCQGERDTSSKNRSRKPQKPQNATRKASSSTTMCCAGARPVVLTKNDYEEEKAFTFSKEQNEERIKKIEALRNRANSNDNRRQQDTNAQMFDRFTYRSDPSYARKFFFTHFFTIAQPFKFKRKNLTRC